jgi:hypothetical protein
MSSGMVRRVEQLPVIPGRVWLRLAVYLEAQNEKGTLLDARDWAIRAARGRGVDVATIRDALEAVSQPNMIA